MTIQTVLNVTQTSLVIDTAGHILGAREPYLYDDATISPANFAILQRHINEGRLRLLTGGITIPPPTGGASFVSVTVSGQNLVFTDSLGNSSTVAIPTSTVDLSGYATSTALTTGLATKVNSSTYTAGLATKIDTAAIDAYIATLIADKTSSIYQALVNYTPPSDPGNSLGFFSPEPRIAATSIRTAVVNVMRNFTKYHLNTWYPSTFGSQSGNQYLTFGGVNEQNIRPAATAAEGIAIDLACGTYNEAYSGVSSYDANVIAKRLTVSVAYRHVANTSGGWGGGAFVPNSVGSNPAWQSALWAACAGKAAWLCWDFYTDAEKTLVKNMLAVEANRFNSVTVPYWKDKTGAENFPGDSKSEENAWNGMLLGVAALVCSDNANVATWTQKFLEFSVSMNATPSDLTLTDTVNGINPSTFLNGWNVNDDGTVINHSVTSPDYMTAPKSAWSVGSLYALSGKNAPAALYLNADKIYRAMVDVVFNTADGFTAPGGTIYKPGSGDIYYPQGTDWGIRYVDKACFDIHGIALGFDRTSSVKADVWAPLHYAKVAAQQARYTDGHTYSGNSEDSYAGREQTIGYNTGYALLALRVAELGLLSVTNDLPAALVTNLQAVTTVVRAPVPLPPATTTPIDAFDAFTTTAATGIPGWTFTQPALAEFAGVDANGAGLLNGTGTTASTRWYRAPASLQPTTGGQSVTITVGAAGAASTATANALIRGSDDGTQVTSGYFARWLGGSTNAVQLYSITTAAGGTPTTTLLSSSALATVPTTITIQAVGSTVAVYVNGGTTPVISTSSTANAAGKVYMGFRYTGTTDNNTRVTRYASKDITVLMGGSGTVAPAPVAPTITATPGDGQFTVSQTAAGSNFSSLALYTSTTNSSDLSVGGTVRDTQLPSVRTGATNGTTYYAQVKVTGEGGTALSNVASVTPAAANPAGGTDGFTTTSANSIPNWTVRTANAPGVVDSNGAGVNGTGSTAVTYWFEAPSGIQPTATNQSAKVAVGALGGASSQTPIVGVRASLGQGTSGLGAGYWARWTGGSTNAIQLYKGSGTSLGTFSLTTAPTSLEIRAVGTTITVYYNNNTSASITATDSDAASGAAWMGFRYTGTSDNSIRARSFTTASL